MELSSFEFCLHLCLPFYSRTIVIDRHGVFTALEEDVYELGVIIMAMGQLISLHVFVLLTSCISCA